MARIWGYTWESDRELLHREPHINLLSQERKYHISVQSSISHHGYAVKNDPTIEVNGFKGCSFVALYLPIKFAALKQWTFSQ